MRAARRPGAGWRSGLAAFAVTSVALLAIGSALFAAWMVSPLERMSGPFGTLAPARAGPAFGPARHQLTTTGAAPILVSGAVVMVDGGTVRAVDLRSRSTYWRLARPGHVAPQSLTAVDDQYAAILWDDRRLTVIDVATGHRWDLNLPDHGLTVPDLSPPAGSGIAVYGLAPSEGGSALVAVVQARRVDAYDAATGRAVWSYRLPRGQAVLDPLSPTVGDGVQPGVATVLLNVSTDVAGSYQQTQAVVLNALGRVTLWLRSPSPAMELGGDRVGLVASNVLQVFDGTTGVPLYELHATDPPYATGDGNLLLSQDVARGTVTAYRAADGHELWSNAFAGAGPQDAPGNGVAVLGIAVYAGRARVLQEYRSEYESCGPNFRLMTVNAAGVVVGIRALPLFSCGTNGVLPSLVGGGPGVVILKDSSSSLAGERVRYTIEIG